MKIPFIDLYAQYSSIKEEIDDCIASLHESGSYINNKFVKDFEKDFSNFINIPFCVGVANGSDALFIALKALDIAEGDHVITTSLSWSSTATSISRTGATIDFVDTDKNGLIDTNQIKQKINPKTKALIVVHLYGNSCSMNEIQSICDVHKIHLIEDCAQAIGSKYKNQPLGSFGIVSTFSFYPTKILGAYGDAGCCVTKDENLKHKISLLANYGISGIDVIDFGINSRLDALQAAVLKVKLKYLPNWINKRQSIQKKIIENVKNTKISFINYLPDSNIQYLVLKTSVRNELQNHLKNKGIDTQIHYPFILPKLSVYSKSENYPFAESLSSTTLSIPCYSDMSELQIDYLIQALNEF